MQCACGCLLCHHNKEVYLAETARKDVGLFGFSWQDLGGNDVEDRIFGPRMVILLIGLLALSFVFVACVYMIAVSLAV